MLLKIVWVVARQKLKPGNNPKNVKQHYDHGGSLQLHRLRLFQNKVLTKVFGLKRKEVIGGRIK
jgi:hypothetical protein